MEIRDTIKKKPCSNDHVILGWFAISKAKDKCKLFGIVKMTTGKIKTHIAFIVNLR